MFNFDDLTDEMIARFWSKVDQSAGPDACWPYTGAHKAKGYGCFFAKRDVPGRNGKQLMVNAHKFAYVITYGVPPTGHLIRHTCDNPPCCSFYHLISGTGSDNQQDVLERNRVDTATRALNGIAVMREYHQRRRTLTEANIAELIVARGKGNSLQVIADQLEIAIGGLSNLLRGVSYRNVPLAQKLSSLHMHGIRFNSYSHNPLHPELQALIQEAERIIIEARNARPTMRNLIKSRAVVLAEMDELFS